MKNKIFLIVSLLAVFFTVSACGITEYSSSSSGSGPSSSPGGGSGSGGGGTGSGGPGTGSGGSGGYGKGGTGRSDKPEAVATEDLKSLGRFAYNLTFDKLKPLVDAGADLS